jgi:DNA-binding LacI/PurR family transcriptional regulator
MAVTSHDVAKRAGVSRSTVSYILNGHGDRFSEETRSLVERAVAELRYRPQAAGRALARGQSDIVLMVMPLAANVDYTALVDALAARLAEKGLSLLLRSATSSAASLADIVAALGPRAVVSLTALSKEELQILDDAGVVPLDLAAATSKVGGPNWQVGQIQVEHLAARGFRTVRFVRLTQAEGDVIQTAREQGVLDACNRLGLQLGQPITVEPRAGRDTALITTVDSGTALACYNDAAAAASLAAAQLGGRSVPGELGIIGADDSSIATYTNPRLTTVGVDAGYGRTLLTAVVESVLAGDSELTARHFGSWQVVPGGTT